MSSKTCPVIYTTSTFHTTTVTDIQYMVIKELYALDFRIAAIEYVCKRYKLDPYESKQLCDAIGATHIDSANRNITYEIKKTLCVDIEEDDIWLVLTIQASMRANSTIFLKKKFDISYDDASNLLDSIINTYS